METHKKPASAWIERVEEIINVLEGSSVGELELIEGDTEITIRRSPGMVLTSVASSSLQTETVAAGPRPARVDQGVPITAPLTGVYYSAASPSMPPFVSVGDFVQIGQVVALVEAMKVFNEINAEVAGRVTALVATSGVVVQKGDALLRIEPY